MIQRRFLPAMKIFNSCAFCFLLLSFGSFFAAASSVTGQRVAVLVPERSSHTEQYADTFNGELSVRAKVIDRSLADAAFRSMELGTPFNMTTAEAKRTAAVVGCEFFILLRTGIQRRVSLAKGDYFEAFAAIYLVSGRNGNLADWHLASFEATTAEEAGKLLFASIAAEGERIAAVMEGVKAAERNVSLPPIIERLPDDDSPAAKGLRPPVPFKRIKPIYTQTAYLYDVRATVDIEVDIGADGTVQATRIVRWAGFGLDESVIDAVRTMNWRAAERAGKTLPMRVLLRYNFTKVED